MEELGFANVSSYVNSGNLLFSATGPASDHEAAIRARLEKVFGFELTTFVRTAEQVGRWSRSNRLERLRLGAPTSTSFR